MSSEEYLPDPEDSSYDEDGDGAIDVSELFSYFAAKRAEETCEDPAALTPRHAPLDSEAIGFLTTDQVCADLEITVQRFHKLKTRLQRILGDTEITVIGKPMGGRGSPGGWGWRLIGNAGDVVGRIYIIARLKNIRGRHVTSRAIAASLTKLAAAPGITLGLGSQPAEDAFRLRLRDLEREEGRLIEDIDRMLADIGT